MCIKFCIPHSHPNGGFWDPSLWGEELGLGLTLAPSEVDTLSDTVLQVHESWLLTEVSTEVCMEACGVILVTTVNKRWVHCLVSTEIASWVEPEDIVPVQVWHHANMAKLKKVLHGYYNDSVKQWRIQHQNWVKGSQSPDHYNGLCCLLPPLISQAV